MKKIIAGVMIIVMAAAFAGCGASESVMEETSAVQATEVTENTAAATETSLGDIGEAQAKQIVLERVPGATEANFTEFSREYDDGMLEYEGEVIYNGYEYEFEINGSTGDVLSWEKDIQD